MSEEKSIYDVVRMNLRAVMDRDGVSSGDELASIINLSSKSINIFLSGIVDYISFSDIAKIAEYFDMTVDDFLYDPDKDTVCTMVDIDVCPMCGKQAEPIYKCKNNPDTYYTSSMYYPNRRGTVKCKGCGLTLPKLYKHVRDAVDVWNKRIGVNHDKTGSERSA